jgi:hypothetical protein
MFERRHEMRLIKHQEGIGSEQSGVHGSHARRDAVALEQNARPDHVDGSHDDRRCCRAFEPLAIVGVLPSQS